MQLSKTEEDLMNHLWKLNKAFMKDLLDEYSEPKPATTTIANSIELTNTTTEKFSRMIDFMQSINETLSRLISNQTDMVEQISLQRSSSEEISAEVYAAVDASEKTKQSSSEIAETTRLVEGVIEDMTQGAKNFTVD